MRIHVTGAAGSGTTTLAAALARAFCGTHLDTDDFYWAPSDPPYTVKRPVPERIALIRAAQGQGPWVLSGSADGWGDGLVETADLVVFLTLPTRTRLQRLKRREAARFGARIRPGGDMARMHGEFLAWAAGYDDPYFGGRSLARHRAWLASRTCPVLEMSGAQPTAEQVQAVQAALAVPVG